MQNKRYMVVPTQRTILEVVLCIRLVLRVDVVHDSYARLGNRTLSTKTIVQKSVF